MHFQMKNQEAGLLLIAFLALLSFTSIIHAATAAGDDDEGIPQCRVNTVNGYHVDLNPLAKSGNGLERSSYSVEGITYEWTYYVNICAAVDDKCKGEKEEPFAIQKLREFIGEDKCYTLSGPANKPEDFIKLEAASTKKADKGAVMTITGGENGDVEIIFECDEKASAPKFEFVGDESYDTHRFVMSTKHACDKEGSASVDGGFDWAWFIFFPGVLGFIMLFALIGFVIYMAAGIYLNKKKFDRAGLELVPNFEFWMSLPGLWKDGLSLIKYGIMTIVYKITKRGAYQSLDAS